MKYNDTELEIDDLYEGTEELLSWIDVANVFVTLLRLSHYRVIFHIEIQ
jgi:hypothetical protein